MFVLDLRDKLCLFRPSCWSYEDIVDAFLLSPLDAGGPAEQREDTGQQPNAGRAEPRPASHTGA